MLNSRPLVELSGEETEQLDVLTPGHFLIGIRIINYPKSRIGLLNRWKLIQKITKDFWKQLEDNIKEGSVVLVKD